MSEPISTASLELNRETDLDAIRELIDNIYRQQGGRMGHYTVNYNRWPETSSVAHSLVQLCYALVYRDLDEEVISVARHIPASFRTQFELFEIAGVFAERGKAEYAQRLQALYTDRVNQN